jgi:hypothetical protein
VGRKHATVAPQNQKVQGLLLPREKEMSTTSQKSFPFLVPAEQLKNEILDFLDFSSGNS